MVEVLALDPHTRTLAVNTPVSCSSRPIIVSCAFVLLSEATSGCKCGLNFVLCLWRELSPSIHRTCGSGDPLNLNATVILSPGWATVSGGRGERTIALSANKKRENNLFTRPDTHKRYSLLHTECKCDASGCMIWVRLPPIQGVHSAYEVHHVLLQWTWIYGEISDLQGKVTAWIKSVWTIVEYSITILSWIVA